MNITRTAESAASYQEKRRVLDLLGNQNLTAPERKRYAQMIRSASSGGATKLYLEITTTLNERS